jgi:hypothetical protein
MLPSFMVLDALFRQSGPGPDGAEVWSLVYIGRTANFLCVASQDGLLLTRPLPSDLSGGEERGEYIDRLVTEVARSQHFARQSAGSPEVQRIVVCGDESVVTVLAECLDEAQDIPVDHWDLTAHFDVGDHPVDEDGWLLLAAAALGGTTGGMNLLEEPRRTLLGAKAKRRLLVGTVALAAVVAPVLWFTGSTISGIHEDSLRSARRQLREAQRTAREAEVVYKQYRAMTERRDLMAAHRAQQHELDRLLLELADLTPSLVTFRDLQIVETDDGMLLSLTAESRANTAERAQQAFLDFIAALGTSRLLGYRGEPRQLEIERLDEGKSHVKRVVFSLDYDLIPPVGEHEG